MNQFRSGPSRIPVLVSVVAVGMVALSLLATRAIAQESSPWARCYETPLVSAVTEDFLDRMAASVGLDEEQVANAQALLRGHVQRWDEFVGRARPAIAEFDDAGRKLPRRSHEAFSYMASREAELEKLVIEQGRLDVQILEELRSVLREKQALAWAELLDETALETARRGPSCFLEEGLCLLSLLRKANIEPDQILPVERRVSLLEALDGWRRSAALASRELIEFRTTWERRYHRDLLPHTMPSPGGGMGINTASPGYGEEMLATTRKMLRVHTAARDATRHGQQAVAAVLGADESLAFLRAYWLAALPPKDRPGFEGLAKTVELILADDSLDAATKRKIREEWNGLSAAWFEHARALVDCEDRISKASCEGSDREKPGRDAERMRDSMRELDRLAASAIVSALGEGAGSVLQAEGVPEWIRATDPG